MAISRVLRMLKECLEETKVDAVMIGRAALGNPWLIKQVVESLRNW